MENRPTVKDDESDLLRMQEEFFASQKSSSVKIAPKSKFAQRREKSRSEGISTSKPAENLLNSSFEKPDKKDDDIFDAVQNVPTNTSAIILGNIIERKITNPLEVPAKPILNETGFPKVFVAEDADGCERESLFLRKIRKQKMLEQKRIEESLEQVQKSVIVEGPMAKEIHDSNVEILKDMSQDEILAEKEKLEQTLGPELVEFLKSRRKRVLEGFQVEIKEDCKGWGKVRKIDDSNTEMEVERKESQNETEKMETEESKEPEELPKPLVEILTEAEEKGWVHMDKPEPEKLKWAEELPEKVDDKPPAEPYDARFDFNGVLLPFKDNSIPVDKGLHHHGDEPDRPGYTIQELLQLSRSSTQQQRCASLSTLANILSKSRRGWYDRALNPAPLVALNEKNVFLLLRFSLDDSSVAVISATLNALREFLVSEADEVCLDRLFGLAEKHAEPELVPVDTKEVTNVAELKDDELVQIDVAAVAMRSNIVMRIRYILSEVKPSPVTVNAALDILITLSRRSKETALNIASMPNLLHFIVSNFIPFSAMKLGSADYKTNAYGVPNICALRLCRVLITYAGIPALTRLQDLKIVNSLVSYLSSDVSGQIGMELQTEALRLWRLLLLNNAAKDSVSGAGLALLSRLQLLLSNHDLNTATELSCEYAGALVLVSAFEPTLRLTINTLLIKWSTQLATLETPTWAKTKLIAQTIMALDDISSMNMSWISNDKLFETLWSSSNLLSAYTPAPERVPSSLPCLNVLTENGELQPAVSKQSCMPFFSVVIKYLTKSSKTESLLLFLSNAKLLEYLEKLVEMEWSYELSWYSRQELEFLSNLGAAEQVARRSKKINASETIWKVSFDLVSALPGDMHEQVSDILKYIFSHEKFNEELLAGQMKSLDFCTSANFELPCETWENYRKFVSRKGNWSEAAMPKDWLYLPLVNAYSKENCLDSEKQTNLKNSIEVKSIKALLILESTIPQLVLGLSASLRFSRICLVFLCKEIYTDELVAPVLEKVLSRFLKNSYKKLELTTSVPGLGSFTDLFTALCENFAAYSYGDKNFAMIILTFIAQKHDVHYRKSLWSEHAYVLQSCRISSNELYIPLSEFLYPAETDVSLIECYVTSLVRKTVSSASPVPSTIATHHSAMYFRQSTSLAEKMRASLKKHDEQLYNHLMNYQPPC